MADSKLLKIILPLDIESLSMRERICTILIYTVPLLLFCLFMIYISGHFEIIILWILFFIFFIPYYYYLLRYEKLEEKYHIKSEIRFAETYEFTSKLLVCLVPGLIITVMTVSCLIDEIPLGLVISSSFIIPSLGLFFRDNAFSDKNCIIGEDIAVGYNPGWYGILSAAIGIFGYISAFKSVNMGISAGLFTVTLIFQIIAVMPDKINSVLFFEARKIEGCAALIFSVAILYLFICSLILGHSAIQLNSIDLSFEGILKKIITWGTGILIAILFARKIKSMNEK